MRVPRTLQLVAFAIFAILTFNLYTNCSDVAFDSNKSSVNGKQGDDVEGDLPPGPGPGPGPTPGPGPGPTPGPGPGPTPGPGPGPNPGPGPGPTPGPGPGPNPNPNPNPVPTPTPNSVPKVSFYGPVCVRGTNCLVRFTLDQPYALPVDFDWRTNNTVCGQPSPTPGAVFGCSAAQGNWPQHYVATQQHAKFNPGETTKDFYVQNVNQTSQAITIRLIFSNCNYGGAFPGCSVFFRP